MLKTKPLKKSEARIIVFLDTTNKALHFVRKISLKLDIDYSYLISVLLSMKEKDWLYTEKSQANPSKTYYHLSVKGTEQLVTAKQLTAETVEVGE